MATTTLDIINRAHRKTGRLGTEGVLSTAEAEQSLDILKSLYQRFIHEGVSGPLRDVILTTEATYTAKENERVFLDSNVTNTVTLPETVTNWTNYAAISDYDEGHMLVGGTEGTERLPRDLAIVSVNDKAQLITEDHIYDGSRKQWFSITTLALTDEAPLSHRDPNGLACLLATELADEYGMPVGDITTRGAIRFQTLLTHNYSQAGEVVTPASYF